MGRRRIFLAINATSDHHGRKACRTMSKCIITEQSNLHARFVTTGLPRKMISLSIKRSTMKFLHVGIVTIFHYIKVKWRGMLKLFIFASKSCNYQSSNRSNLQNHVNSNQISAKNFACSNCDYRTAQENDFTIHERAHQEKMKKCNMCDFETSSQERFIEHVKYENSCIIELNNRCDVNFNSDFEFFIPERQTIMSSIICCPNRRARALQFLMVSNTRKLWTLSGHKGKMRPRKPVFKRASTWDISLWQIFSVWVRTPLLHTPSLRSSQSSIAICHQKSHIIHTENQLKATEWIHKVSHIWWPCFRSAWRPGA